MWFSSLFQRFKGMRIEPRILIAFALAAGSLFAFSSLTEEVLEGETHVFDRAVIMGLRAPGDLATPLGPHWLLGVFRDITTLGGTTIITLATILAVSYLLVARLHKAALLVALSVSLGAILENAMKSVFGRARPDVVPHLVEVSSLSYPSGHAMLSAITYLTLALLLAEVQPRRALRIFVLLTGVAMTLLIGFSRIYLGVHWPTDVIAGWTAGAFWALGVWAFARRLGATALAV